MPGTLSYGPILATLGIPLLLALHCGTADEEARLHATARYRVGMAKWRFSGTVTYGDGSMCVDGRCALTVDVR